MVVLTVAHVYDKRPESASFLNLAALCQRCHNRHDARDRRRNRLAWLNGLRGQLEFFDKLFSINMNNYSHKKR